VPADHRGLEPGGARQLDRLRELARRHLDFVPSRRELAGQRPEERRVRRVREVNPDEHKGNDEV
jgi:hypothetical protein